MPLLARVEDVVSAQAPGPLRRARNSTSLHKVEGNPKAAVPVCRPQQTEYQTGKAEHGPLASLATL